MASYRLRPLLWKGLCYSLRRISRQRLSYIRLGNSKLSGNSRWRDASLERGAKLNGGASPVAPSSGERKKELRKVSGPKPIGKYIQVLQHNHGSITAAAVRDWAAGLDQWRHRPAYSITSPLVGSWNRKRAPLGTLGKARRCPPCNSMIVRLTASPIPMPSGLVV